MKSDQMGTGHNNPSPRELPLSNQARFSGSIAVGSGSAPGDRPGVVGESPIRRRNSDPGRPGAVRVWPRGQGRSVGRGSCRPAIEPRKSHGSGCRRCYQSGRPHERGRQREPPVDPAWSETLACAHAPGTGTGRSPARPQALGPSGPHREGEEPSPMMHGREKSDLARGAAKPANNDGRPSAELVERRAGAEGNAGQDRTRRAQDRVSVSQGLDRVRHVSPSATQGGSRVPELGPLGSVRGALSNERPYRDSNRDPGAEGPHWPYAGHGAEVGMLVVETIAKIRRAYFVHKKPIKA